MKKYVPFLFLISVLIIIIGLLSGKIGGDSFTYISITGTLYAMLQILIVTLILMLAVVITVPALIIDLILLIFTGMYFPMVSSTWNIVWTQVTIQWFWNINTGSSLLFSSILIAIISFFLMRKRR